MLFKIDWASLIVGSKFTVFALFYFVFEGNFPSTSPRGAYIWRGLYMEGLIFGILRYHDVNLWTKSSSGRATQSSCRVFLSYR